mmetsp:Transcript_53086/g.149565  ORF Transcript_53086/g.149565 Transcript_53086/m.149565 type:complete len:270 (+) Transcript_53086:217-1026(+)
MALNFRAHPDCSGSYQKGFCTRQLLRRQRWRRHGIVGFYPTSRGKQLENSCSPLHASYLQQLGSFDGRALRHRTSPLDLADFGALLPHKVFERLARGPPGGVQEPRVVRELHTDPVEDPQHVLRRRPPQVAARLEVARAVADPRDLPMFIDTELARALHLAGGERAVQPVPPGRRRARGAQPRALLPRVQPAVRADDEATVPPAPPAEGRVGARCVVAASVVARGVRQPAFEDRGCPGELLDERGGTAGRSAPRHRTDAPACGGPSRAP